MYTQNKKKLNNYKFTEKNIFLNKFNNFNSFLIKLSAITLFTFPFLFFLKNVTRNPYDIQQIIFLITMSAIFILSFISKILNSSKKYSNSNINTENHFYLKTYKFILAEKIMFLFFAFCFVSWIIAFFKFPTWHLAVLLEGEKAFNLIIFNTILIYFLPFILNDKKFEEAVWKTIFYVGILASLYGILQVFNIELFWTIDVKKFGNRSVSTFGNPNFLSSFLVMLIPICLHFILIKKSKFFYILAFIIFFTALISTYTRSSWIGIFIGIIFYFFTIFLNKKNIFIQDKTEANKKSLKKFKIISILALLIIISSSVFYQPIKNRIKESINLSFNNKSIFQRILIWESGKDMFLDNKLTGVGWGLFELNFPFYQGKYLTNKKFTQHKTHANNAHNEILEILSQTGIIGFSIYILFFILFFYTCFKIIKNKETKKEDKLLIIAYISSIIGMISDNMLNVSLHIATPMTLFWFIIGCSIKIYKENHLKEKTFHFNSIKKIIFIITTIVILLFITFRQISLFLSEKEYFKSIYLLDNKQNPNSIILLQAKQFLENSNKFRKYEVNKLYELGKVNSQLGLTDEAIKAYSDAILTNPGYDEPYFSRGGNFIKKENFKNAKKDLLQANSLSPMNINIIYGIFTVYLNQKNYEKCIEFLKKGYFIDPKNYHIVCAIGACYSFLGDFDKAVNFYNKALEINPDFSLAKNNLENAKNKMPGNFTIFKFD
jgi:O-antigen ligase